MKDEDLDSLIGTLPRRIASDALLRRVREIPLRHSRPEPLFDRVRALFSMLALGSSLALGVLLGFRLEDTSSALATDSGTANVDSGAESSTDELDSLFDTTTTSEESLEL